MTVVTMTPMSSSALLHIFLCSTVGLFPAVVWILCLLLTPQAQQPQTALQSCAAFSQATLWIRSAAASS